MPTMSSEPGDGSVRVVGTAHVSEASVKDVEAAIEAVIADGNSGPKRASGRQNRAWSTN